MTLTPKLVAAIERWRLKQEAARAFGFYYMQRKRYMEHRSVSFERFGDGLAAIECGHIGLRLVGCVEYHQRSGVRFVKDGKTTGYYTNIDNDVMKNGEGLVWGVVYQLPADRVGRERFIAGYEVGGSDEIVLDLKRGVFREAQSNPGQMDAEDCEACRDAARWADGMAEKYSNDERQYQWEQREKEEEYERETREG